MVSGALIGAMTWRYREAGPVHAVQIRLHFPANT
jgi:hypothetical protein